MTAVRLAVPKDVRITYPAGHRAPRLVLRLPTLLPEEHPFDRAFREAAERKAAARARVLVIGTPGGRS